MQNIIVKADKIDIPDSAKFELRGFNNVRRQIKSMYKKLSIDEIEIATDMIYYHHKDWSREEEDKFVKENSYEKKQEKA